jgi:hypothetical protein
MALGTSHEPYFPLRAEPSVVNDSVGLQTGAVLYRQALHPLAAIRTPSPVPLHYAAGKLSGNLDVTVPAGAVFLSTVFDNSLYFCSAQSLQNSFLLGVVEVALCLRDTDNDGVADQQIVLGNGGYRVESVFDLVGEQKNVSVTPVSIAYQKISSQELPELALKMSVERAAGLFRSGWAVTLQVCVPAEFSTAPKDGVRCAYVDWKDADVVDTVSVAATKGSIKFDAGNVATVQWGPVALSLQRQAGEMVAVKSVREVPQGTIALIGKGKLEEQGAVAPVVDFLNEAPIPALMETDAR